MDRHYPNKNSVPNNGTLDTESADVLCGRFTNWLDVLVYRAKLKYIRKLSQDIEAVSLDELIDSGFQPVDPVPVDTVLSQKSKSFEFEEEKLARAFSDLPIKRQRILEMLFIEQMKPEEIAKELNCTVQHVYNRRSSALKQLRLALTEGDDLGDKR